MKTDALMMIAALAFALVACRTPTVPEVNPYASKAEAAQAGAKLFRQHCAECHGVEAMGHGKAPSLRTPAVEYRSDHDLFEFITNGELRAGMPAWSRLPEQRRWQLVAYLRTLHSAD